MDAWLQQIDFWHWWVLGVALVILEVFSPGVFFLWLGVAAGVVGVVVWLVPDLSWEYQILIFAAASVTSIALGRSYLKRNPIETDQPMLNRRGEQYVGRVFTLEHPIDNGVGKIRVDDSTWKISGEDCAAGTRIKVIGVDGVVLRVDIVE
jgi:membrane protein implicated in regulation of membrane protease activity